MGAKAKLTSVCVLALAAVMAFPSGAQAVGELTNAGCVDDVPSGADTCAQTTAGLIGATNVAVSPDGSSVYVASLLDDAIVLFNRSSTGALTPAGCIEDDDTGLSGCAQSADGLNDANSVAVSPDGASVYVAGGLDDAIVSFNRSSTGALTPAGCIDDNDTGDDTCARSVNGLDGARSVAVSPDGRSVYVASSGDDAVVRFNRSSTGALTSGGCVDDNDSGPDTCAQSVNGLDGATWVTSSPDGTSVYATSFADQAVVRFNRSSTGALTAGGCVDDNDTGNDTGARSVNGLDGAISIVVSPDGASAYVAGAFDHAVVRFNRSTTGALTPGGCVDDNDSGNDTCARSVNGLAGANSVAVSPDGRSVYLTGPVDDAIVLFDRSAAGAPTSGGCVDDNDSGPDTCAQSVNGLDFASSVAVSPDGRSAYVASRGDHAVVRFNRAS